MKVAISGATGHLGGLLIRELHHRNHQIKALVRGENHSALDGIPLEIVKGDLHDTNALHLLMLSCDMLIHSAGYISVDGNPGGMVHKTNVEGTRNIMEAAKHAGIRRVIHISSIHAFQQKPIHEILDEHREKVNHQAFAYDRSKKAGEEIALSYASDDMEVIVIHPTSIISPHDFKPSKMGKAILQLCTGKLPFVFEGGFDFCDGRDVATAIANALTMGRNGESYILSGKWHSFKDLAAALASISGTRINTIALPLIAGWMSLPLIKLYAIFKKEEPLYTNEALVAIADGNRNINCAKAIKELHYTPRPFEETIRDTYSWFLQNGYIDSTY